MKGVFNNTETLADMIGKRLCIRTEAVLRWMTRKGYTVKDFGKIIKETRDIDKFTLEVLNAQN